MPAACPHCLGTGYLPDASATASTDTLRAACRARGIWLSHDDLVREDAAADLIGMKPKTLSNWRHSSAKLPFTVRAGRPLYALADLAEYLAHARN